MALVGTNESASASPAFELGWMMAQVYGPLLTKANRSTVEHLPTVAEMDQEDRMVVAFAEIDGSLQVLVPTLNANSVRVAWPASGGDPTKYKAALRQLNAEILTDFSVKDPALATAYQLGRALSDTCWLPNTERGATYFLHQFSRYRVSTLQAWIGEAGARLPANASSIVSQSLQNWQIWANANSGTLSRHWATTERTVLASLRAQSHSWRGLLSGNADASADPGVDAWVHAGESMLRSAKRIGRLVLTRFWLVLAVILSAVGGLMYLSLADSSGTAKVWTSLVTIAGGFGITGAGIRAAWRKATGAIERSVVQSTEVEARAWSVTVLPALPIGLIRQARLRSAGLTQPTGGGRIDKVVSATSGRPASAA